MRIPPSVLFSVFLAAGVLSAETTRQLSSHEHAVQRINFAVQGDQLYLEFFAPANDVVGFEYSPSTPEQKQAVDQAIGKLEQGDSIFAPNDTAGCQLRSAVAVWQGEGEHEEHEEHERGSHAEFRANYQFDCDAIDALEEIDVGVFKLYPGVNRIDVQGVSNEGQMAVTLRADSNKIMLKP